MCWKYKQVKVINLYDWSFYLASVFFVMGLLVSQPFLFFFFFLYKHFIMTYVVKGFHPCPADSCSPGTVASQHAGYSDSFLNTDSWDPFCIYWSWRDFMKKLSGQREWGCWQFPLECGCRCQGNQISLVVKGIRPFVCTCSQNICSVHGNNACGNNHHLVFLVLTQCLLWNYRW